MIPFTRLDDHRNAKGDIDWPAYRKAQIANGEVCKECRGLIMHNFPAAVERRCYACEELRKITKEVSHSNMIRCPKCRHIYSLPEDWYDGASDSEFSTYCPECDHSFTVGIIIERTFTSPEILPPEKEHADATLAELQTVQDDSE